LEQEVRFCRAGDGVRIAYATVGDGPPLVKTANWLNHLEFDWDSPLWRGLFRELASSYRLIRYDERGNGLSDWNVGDLSLDAFVHDLESVVDAAGLDSFSLLGISQGCAISIAYAVRHPERVRRLVLLGGYARGWARRGNAAEMDLRRAMLTFIKQGWGQNTPAFRQLWSSLYIPDGTPEQMDWFVELQRRSASPENASRLSLAFSEIDVRALLPRVSLPTLVLHARNDSVIPFEEGRILAAEIPGARLVVLEGRNHIPLEHEPAHEAFLRETRAFLGPGSETARRPEEAGRAAAPRTLGAYRLLARLGEGGMGEVWRAEDTVLRRTVAIKILRSAGGDDAGGRRRLLHEARALAALDHPNIAPVYGFEEAGGTPFLVLGFVDGESLADEEARGPRSAERVVHLLRQIAAGLGAAHAGGILHRDLKPANIMVNREGVVKLVDFGIARHGDATALTPDGFIIGTLAYMSPEQARGDPLTPACDFFSLGVVLYELLTGRRLFARDSAASTLHAVLNDDPPPFDRSLPKETLALEPLVRRCLMKVPARRFQSAHDLMEVLP
jgi:pimeloyl-ACP methyl ester carboxylesterase